MLAIAYMDKNDKGFCGTKDPWVFTCEGMSFFDINMKIVHIKIEGCIDPTVFQLNEELELITWDYVLDHLVIGG